ncbi:HIT-like domain-containing protein [Suillus clintonianus]|uniref:HIT-like domain-containing protein n=1 Tax=Suillus clintonianus TaxID=1904413 RepID=UPI001B85E8B3|nr:HIT-like domain-containing protein [Suillus clintonianus]KAG2130866.1 HIT-like domain-containing protein [Suillus clintonianus]
MDTLLRHKSFLLTSAILFLTTIFTGRTNPPTEDIVPVESTTIKPDRMLPTTTTPSRSMDTTSNSLPISKQSTNVDEGTLPHGTSLDDKCVFCKIVAGKEPSFKVYETKYSLAFLAKPPVSHGHTLIIPKYHSRTLTDPGLPDEFLADVGPIMKKIAVMNGDESYNIIQNNGVTAGQSVHHVHFHVVTKPDDQPNQGLVLTRESWPSYTYAPSDEDYARDAAKMKEIGRANKFPGVSNQNLDEYGI